MMAIQKAIKKTQQELRQTQRVVSQVQKKVLPQLQQQRLQQAVTPVSLSKFPRTS
jgi:hypothetical protein